MQEAHANRVFAETASASEPLSSVASEKKNIQHPCRYAHLGAAAAAPNSFETAPGRHYRVNCFHWGCPSSLYKISRVAP